MTVIKEWDGTQWVPIVVGKQGPPGADSTVPGPTGPTGPPVTVVYDDIDNILAHQVFS
jgi:hypothetical protein